MNFYMAGLALKLPVPDGTQYTHAHTQHNRIDEARIVNFVTLIDF